MSIGFEPQHQSEKKKEIRIDIYAECVCAHVHACKYVCTHTYMYAHSCMVVHVCIVKV